jgi:hypothetical protein
VFTLQLDPMICATFEEICEEGQRIAKLLGVLVEFNVNGVTCMAWPDGTAEKMVKNLRHALSTARPSKLQMYAPSV